MRLPRSLNLAVRILPPAFAIVLALAQAGCRRSDEPKARPPTPVRVRVVAPPVEQSASRFSGSVEPGVRVDLAFKVGGYIREISQVKGQDKVARPIQEGDWVKKGTVLAIVRESDYQQRLAAANAALAQAKAAQKQAQLDHDRLSKLLASNAIAQAEVEGAKARLEVANAQVQGARAQISEADLMLSDCTLRAPMDGVVIRRSVEVGSLVGPGAVGFVVADTRTVKVAFGAPDTLITKLSLGSAVTIRLEALGLEVQGTISRIAPSADPKSRVFDIQATLPNPDDKVKVGMIASLKIAEGGGGSQILSLPLTAVVRPPKDPRGFAVFVAEGQPGSEVARLREVKLGDVLGNAVLVTEGLVAGDRVIASGATLVADGEKVNVVP
jgi:multidrug efflux system membrane fusion protein